MSAVVVLGSHSEGFQEGAEMATYAIHVASPFNFLFLIISILLQEHPFLLMSF